MSQGAVNINPAKRRIMAHADDDINTVAELVQVQWRTDRRLQNLPSAFVWTGDDKHRVYQIRHNSNWKVWWMKDGIVTNTLPRDTMVIGTNGVNFKPQPQR